MRVTIIRDDGVAGVDGSFRPVDLSALPPEIRAVQWNGARGHVEYDNAANTPLDSIAEFQWVIDRWATAAPQPLAAASTMNGVWDGSRANRGSGRPGPE